MAEAIAVAGLAASIVTFVDIGAKIVSRVNDFVAQSSEVPQSFRSLAERLPLLIATLQRVRARAQSGGVPDVVAHGLQKLVTSTVTEVRFLEESIAKITPATDASRLTKGIKGLQSLMKDEKVRQTTAKIDNAINVLVLNQLDNNIDLSDRILQELARLNLKAFSPRPQHTFGLCLGQAPRIEPSAFLGRTRELQQLHDWLAPGGSNYAQKVVSVVGMGGLGKTQLSLAYVQRHGSQYSSVFWINAKDKSSLQQGLSSLSRIIFANSNTVGDAGDDELQVERVRKWLSEPWNDQWLLLFDNYDDPALPNTRSATGFDIRAFFPFRAQGHILITTRSPKLMFSQRLMLESLRDVALGVAILSQRSGQDLTGDENATLLALRLAGLPLALVCAGTYMGQTGASCQEYHALYDNLWTDLHGNDSELLFEYENRTLSSTWTISLSHVDEQDADTAKLFKFLAFFDNEDVNYDIIRAGAQEGPDRLGRVTATKLRFDRALSTLMDYSLVELVPGAYRVHPCVHDWLLEYFQQKPNEAWFVTALNCVQKSIPGEGDEQSWTTKRKLLGHVQRLRHARFTSTWQILFSQSNVLFANYIFALLFIGTGQHATARDMLTQTLPRAEEAFGPDHSLTLNTIYFLGSLLAGQGNLAEAERMHTRALAGYKKILRADHLWTFATVHCFGNLLVDRGDLVEAERMYIRALTGQEKALGADHPLTLATVHSFGDVQVRHGNLVEAERMYMRALAGQEKAQGPDHPSTLTTVHSLGKLFSQQDKLMEAEQMHTRALAGYMKTLGPDHVSTFGVIYHLGRLFTQQGKLVEAEQMYTQVLAEYEEVLGPDHPSTLRIARRLRRLYGHQDKVD